MSEPPTRISDAVTGSAGASLAALVLPNATVFVSSFCIMVIELVAGRIVARHFGTSIYTWTSVIGVVLAGIAAGNYLGGLVADRFAARRAMATLFLLSSAAAASIAVLDSRAGESIALWQMPWQQAHVAAYVALVFFVPSCCLGMISPVAATMALDAGYRRGRTIGGVYAWSVIGSIIGTFVTGFFLIQLLGTGAIIWSVAGILAVIAICYGAALRRTWVWAVLLAGLATLASGSWSWAESLGGRFGLRRPAPPDVLYTDESQYSFVEVFKVSDEPEVLGMHLDTLLHSEYEPSDPDNLRYDYERIFAAVTHRFAQDRRRIDTLMLGGGGYVFPRYLVSKWPGSRTDVVEIDPAVTEAAMAAFGLPRDTPINCFHEDGRVFVNRLARRISKGEAVPPYDLIYCDAVNDYLVPYQLTTQEYLRKVVTLLRPDGAYLINAIDIFESGRFLGALVNTAKTVFPYVYVLVDGVPVSQSGNSRSTFVITCLLEDRDMDELGPDYRSDCRVFRVNDDEMAGLSRRAGDIVLTDTFAPVENLLAPVFLQAAEERAVAKLMERIDALESRGSLDQAIPFYEKLIKARPGDTVTLSNFGIALARCKMYERAIEQFRAAIEIRPDYADAYNNWGAALSAQGQYDSAISRFDEALRLRPDLIKAQLGRAEALLRMGRLDESLESYGRAASLDPGCISAHLNMASILDSKGRFDEAEAACRRALAIDPGERRARQLLERIKQRKRGVD